MFGFYFEEVVFVLHFKVLTRGSLQASLRSYFNQK